MGFWIFELIYTKNIKKNTKKRHEQFYIQQQLLHRQQLPLFLFEQQHNPARPEPDEPTPELLQHNRPINKTAINSYTNNSTPALPQRHPAESLA